MRPVGETCPATSQMRDRCNLLINESRCPSFEGNGAVSGLRLPLVTGVQGSFLLGETHKKEAKRPLRSENGYTTGTI